MASGNPHKTHELNDMTSHHHTPWNDFIKGMPKVELHLHLEGAFTFPTLLQLIQKYGGAPEIRTIQDLRHRFAYTDFPHFIETWKWKNQFFRAPEDFELSVYETLRDLHSQNVAYVEAFYSPWDFEGNGISMQSITHAVLRAKRKAHDEFGIQCALIADINRDFGPERGAERVDEVAVFRGQGVIGIGLGGSEHQYPAELFVEAFAKAKQFGLHRVAHAGEAAGAGSIWGAVRALEAERIGHGTRAIDDPMLIDELRTRRIPLEVCLTSNICTGVVRSLESHPVKDFLHAGLVVTINTDDPTMFGCTLTDEYVALFERVAASPELLRTVGANAIDSSFLDERGKRELHEHFDRYWKRAPHDAR